jgi:endonuclease/exonuclease/phosphatase family metal-dependent hydrolase
MRGQVVRRRVAPAFIATLLCVSCSDSLAGETPPVPQDIDAQHPEVGAIELNVMTFNIWLGGNLVDFNQVIEAIELAGADVVGLQEAAGHTDEIADRLGWFASPRMHVISRYPIIEPPEGDQSFVYVQIAPGQVVAVANIHLPSDPYGPELIRDGESVEAVLANEAETRLSALEPMLPAWQQLIDSGVPLFLTGDFNSPSHRDWTPQQVGALPHMTAAVEWPVTMAVEGIGLVDTFRAANPDPAADPGRTWTYGYPYPRLAADEVIDRIDLVFASTGVTTVASRVVGQAGTPDVDVAIDPYPSDHRGVVSTVMVDPVEPPVFVAVEQVRVVRGQPFGVRYHSPGGEATDRLVVVPSGQPAGGGSGIMWLPPMEANYFGQVLFGSGNLEPGAYDVVLVTTDDAELSRSPFWVVAPDAVANIVVAASVAAGEPIEVSWSGAPAERFDWVAVYPAGELDLYNAYLAFAYTAATVEGSYTFGADDLGDEMLPAGDYVAVLASDDHYIVLASAPFTVTPAGG